MDRGVLVTLIAGIARKDCSGISQPPRLSWQGGEQSVHGWFSLQTSAKSSYRLV